MFVVNVDTTGTIEMANALSQMQTITCLHKYMTKEELSRLSTKDNVALSNSTMSQWKSKYANKKVRITKNGITFDAYVKDTCADKDCGGCCTRNAKGKILIDIEFYTAKKYLGSLGAADGSATFTLL